MRNDCPIPEERLDDLLDGLLPAADATDLEAHAAGCATCRARLEAGRSLARRVARLSGAIEPPHDRWPEIRAAITRTPKRAAYRAWLAAACVIVGLGLAGLVGYRVGVGHPPTGPGANAARAVGDAEREYARAASAFLAALDERLETLSPDSRDAILESLDELDRAIAQLRLALDDDPSDVEANRSWNALYRRKIRLLRSVSRLSS
jgi:anti-sigma factor RsiW